VPPWRAGHKDPQRLPPNTELMQPHCTMWKLLRLGGVVARDHKEPHAALLLAVPGHVNGNIAFPCALANLIHKHSSFLFCNLLQVRSDLHQSCRISKTDLH